MEKTIEERVYELEQLLFTNKKVLSFDEASKFLNLSKSYLYKLTSGNLIPHYKPQGKMLYCKRPIFAVFSDMFCFLSLCKKYVCTQRNKCLSCLLYSC